MSPLQVARALRRVASKIESSNRPDRQLIAKDLNNILKRIASHHSSGDPSQPGGFDLSIEPKFIDPKVVFSVYGTVSGKDIMGELTLYGELEDWTGYDYEPTEGSFDIADDMEGVGQIVLDAAEEAAAKYYE